MKKKTKQRLKKIAVISMIVVIALPLFSGFMQYRKPVSQSDLTLNQKQIESMMSVQDETKNERFEPVPNIKGDYKVTKVHDGATLSVMWGDEESQVKLIGIKIPERVEEKALAFLKKELEEIDMVSLEFDKDKKDKDGNLLAYAYLPDNIYTSLNIKLLEKGYAQLDTESENVKYIEDLKGAQKFAKEKNIGCWEEKEIEVKDK